MKENYNNQSFIKKLNGLSSALLIFYVIVLVLSVFFIIAMVIMNRMGFDYIYMRYVSAIIFGCLFFIPVFIFLCLYVIKTLYSTIKQFIFLQQCKRQGIKTSQKLEISILFYIIAGAFLLVLGAGAKLSTEAVINSIKDYSHQDHPQEITLEIYYLRQERTKNLSFSRKDYRLYGKDQFGIIHEFKLIDVYKITDNYDIAHIKYLPHTKIVIDYELIKKSS